MILLPPTPLKSRIDRLTAPSCCYEFPFGLLVAWEEHFIRERQRTLAHKPGGCPFCDPTIGVRPVAGGFGFDCTIPSKPARASILPGAAVRQLLDMVNIEEPFGAVFEREGRDKTRALRVLRAKNLPFDKAEYYENRPLWQDAYIKWVCRLMYPVSLDLWNRDVKSVFYALADWHIVTLGHIV